MKILYVVNNAFAKGNGLSASCRRTVQYLRDAGEDVRILSAGGSEDERPDYPLPDYPFPVFDELIRKQGYSFAKEDDDVIREAVRWADIVHLEEPFELQARTCKIAKEENTPVVATYHLHPENLFSSVHLRKSVWFNFTTMLWWRNTVFNHCRIIQCPTENVRERLVRWNYRPELRLISNGMIPMGGDPVPSPIEREEGTFLVVCTGRYSIEKDQITLLKAMKYSRFADRIRLVLAGRGPNERQLRRAAAKLVRRGVLKHPPVFGFFGLAELRAIYRRADLYIHCAVIEVEGLSCMEAIQEGVVPIIAKGKLTATAQYAKDEESRYPERNAKALAARIDYWLSDDDRRKKTAERYRGAGAEYDIHHSIDALQKMYRDALDQSFLT